MWKRKACCCGAQLAGVPVGKAPDRGRLLLETNGGRRAGQSASAYVKAGN